MPRTRQIKWHRKQKFLLKAQSHLPSSHHPRCSWREWAWYGPNFRNTASHLHESTHTPTQHLPKSTRKYRWSKPARPMPKKAPSLPRSDPSMAISFGQRFFGAKVSKPISATFYTLDPNLWTNHCHKIGAIAIDAHTASTLSDSGSLVDPDFSRIEGCFFWHVPKQSIP